MKKNSIFRQLATGLIILTVVSGISSVAPFGAKNVPEAKAADFSFRTGYYIGDGSTSLAITGLGFAPEVVMIKAQTNAGVATHWAYTGWTVSCYLHAANCQTSGSWISMTADGFTLQSTNVTAGNIRYMWVAFDGSDCTSNGTFCFYYYTATGSALNVTSVGFQPDLVIVKKYAAGTSSAARPAWWWSSAMAATESVGWTNANASTTDITGALNNGFTLGTGLNANDAGGSNDIYYYMAFKSVAAALVVGSYTVGAVESDDANITGFGAGNTPQFAWVKGRNTTTAQYGVWHMTDHNGDWSDSPAYDSNGVTDCIQNFIDGGIEIGTNDRVSEANKTYYWVMFGGGTWPSATGTFTMKTGTFAGDGATTKAITGVGFQPDLVILKDTSTNYAVFKTKMMRDDTTNATTAYFSPNDASDNADCIRTLDADGFTVGDSNGVTKVFNTNANVYHYIAFGNASDPYDRGGAADFAVGAYWGNGIDSDLNITNLGFQPDMVVVKRGGGSTGVWRSSSETGDNALFFNGTAETSDYIQSFSSTGFQVGGDATVNTSGAPHWWFAFKKGSNFDTGSYTGSGRDNTSLPSTTTIKTRPDLAWIKDASTQVGVLRPSSIANTTDSTLYFENTAAATNRIDQFNAMPVGFRVDNNVEVNTSDSTYYYTMWRIPIYTPNQQDWRWFDAENDSDANLDTTTGSDTTAGDALAAENNSSSSTRIVYPGNILKFRVKIGETEAKAGTDVKYKIQYDTDPEFGTATDVGVNDSAVESWIYDSDNTDGYVDDAAIEGSAKLAGSPTLGRHNEDSTATGGEGSSFDPAASTTYEHEFIIQASASSVPTPDTVYYFRILFATSSTGLTPGPWTIVPLGATETFISLQTAASYDLEVSTAPSDVNLGTSTGGDINYDFTADEKIGFWDKRGSGATYNVNTSAFDLRKTPDSVPGTDITWTSSTDSLTGVFASSKSGMATASPYTTDSAGSAYIADPGTEGKGGFVFQPNITIVNLSSAAVGDYTAVLTITVV
jgi:hypothetical protein